MNERKDDKEEEEIAASIDGDSVETPFEWVLPKENTSSNIYLFNANRDETQVDEYEPLSNERKPGLPIHRKKQRPSFKRNFPNSNTPFQIPKQLLVPIGSAIAIGCIIGLVVLMIFTGDDFGSQTTTAAKEAPGTPVQNPISDPTAGTIDLSMTPYIVQGGLFSSLTNAEDFAGKVKAAGYSAVVDPTDNRVIIGVGGSMEDVRTLASDFQDVVEDAYPYQWEIQAAEIAVTEKNDLKWLGKGIDLLQGTFATDQVQEQEQELLSWKKEALSSISALESEQQQKAVAFINSLSSLPEQAEDKWELQQAKLEALIHYKALIGAFDK